MSNFSGRTSNFDSDITPADIVSVHPVTREACVHQPHCPDAAGPDRDAAHVIACHPEQGWSLLCNGVVLFEDSGEILPDGHCVHARRADLTAAALHRVA
ncbi:MAG: hypothetical protein QOH56_2551 [Pseudonocardiales bacterium]|nr:hypothetical protein [Pseudonocardiales bacterium]